MKGHTPTLNNIRGLSFELQTFQRSRVCNCLILERAFSTFKGLAIINLVSERALSAFKDLHQSCMISLVTIMAQGIIVLYIYACMCMNIHIYIGLLKKVTMAQNNTWISIARASSPPRRFWIGCISSFSYLHYRRVLKIVIQFIIKRKKKKIFQPIKTQCVRYLIIELQTYNSIKTRKKKRSTINWKIMKMIKLNATTNSYLCPAQWICAHYHPSSCFLRKYTCSSPNNA